MSIQTKLNIGLFGFGVVGESLWQVLQGNSSLQATIKKVCIKDATKERNAPGELFTNDPAILLDDESINVIVELISDAEAAYIIVTTSLLKGKAVVSANKKMIAEHLQELLDLQQETGASFLYEAACCASIPVIRNLEEYYDNNLLQGISGIVNGSTNYILTKIAADGLDFNTALQQAQKEGFAESDPALDIEGTDAVNKLTILLAHAYGIVTGPSALVKGGITSLHEQDARYAREKDYAVKLVAHARKGDDGTVTAFVLPQFLQSSNRLYHVQNEYNGVVIESALADQQFFNGKGAGGYPTASAVISDLSALRYNYRYEYKKLYHSVQHCLDSDFCLQVYFSFNVDNALPADFFDNITEWASNDKRSFVIGTVHVRKLLGSTWWKEDGNSLIAMPDVFGVSKRIRKIPATERIAILA